MRPPGYPVAVLAALAGCAQIFDLDETSGIETRTGASFTYTRTLIGTKVDSEPFDLTDVVATYLVEDDKTAGGFGKVVATLSGPGQWQAEISRDAQPQLVFTTADNVIRHFALPNRAIAAVATALGKLASVPAPTGAALDFNVTLAAPFAAGHGLSWTSVGTWTGVNYAAAALPAVGATVFNPGSALYPATARKMTTEDALLFLHYNGRQLIGQFTATPFEQTAAATVITGRLLAVPLDRSLSISLDTTAPATRLAGAKPALNPPVLNWNIAAAPGGFAGLANGPVLHAGTPTVSTGVVPVVAAYGNPFAVRDWASTFTWSATATRAYTPPGFAAVTLTGRLLMLLAPPSDSRALDFPSCLPTAISIGTAALVTDGLTVTIDRTRPVAVTFIADNQEADLYGLNIIEVVNAAGPPARSTLTTRLISTSLKPTWSLPNDVFAAGKMYTLRVTCTKGGFPRLSEGDLVSRELPTAQGFLDSGVFTVAP
jgi:hypothetical protein